MTIEELADLTSERLKALSDKELFEIISIHFPQTRPEMIVKPERHSTNTEPAVKLNATKMKALAMLAEEGCEIQFRKKKK